MKRRLLVLLSAAAFALALAGPAAAQCPAEEDGEPGRSEFAKNHIVPFAQGGMLGQGHKPGKAHQGASDCAALHP